MIATYGLSNSIMKIHIHLEDSQEIMALHSPMAHNTSKTIKARN